VKENTRPTKREIRPCDVSVVIATYERPDVLRECLSHLERQTKRPLEILVVDGSASRSAESITSAFRGVRYLHNTAGLGTLPLSRRLGVEHSTGAAIAFLDDDAFAAPSWLEELAATYEDGVGGVGGRALNGQPDEAREGVGEIGRLLPNGLTTGYFAADPGSSISVDHLIGCNMSFRRRALEEAGGIPDWPAGVSAVREDLLLSLRVSRAGWTLRFNPKAVVRHIGAPQARGRRFDLRYELTATRNHIFVLAHHFGFRHRLPPRAVVAVISGHAREVRTRGARAVPRLVAASLGVVLGLYRAVTFNE
jgi:GT2 family glycosyltransferase